MFYRLKSGLIKGGNKPIDRSINNEPVVPSKTSHDRNRLFPDGFWAATRQISFILIFLFLRLVSAFLTEAGSSGFTVSA